MHVEQARNEDFPAICDLLTRAKLPLDGLEAARENLFVLRSPHGVAGCVALDVHGASALLRSLAVEDSERGEGFGVTLLEVALQRARNLGVEDVYLLTETAAAFFLKFGFETCSRASAPPSMQQTEEFRSACPASAVCLRLGLS